MGCEQQMKTDPTAQVKTKTLDTGKRINTISINNGRNNGRGNRVNRRRSNGRNGCRNIGNRNRKQYHVFVTNQSFL